MEPTNYAGSWGISALHSMLEVVAYFSGRLELVTMTAQALRKRPIRERVRWLER